MYRYLIMYIIICTYTYIHTYIQIIHTYRSYIHIYHTYTHTHTHTHTQKPIYIYIYIYIYRYRYTCIHQQLRMTCTELILWRSWSRNTCDVCTCLGGVRLPTNSNRSACVSLCGCSIVCTCHDSRSSRCRRSLRCLQVNKSQSETAPVSSFHFLQQEQQLRGFLPYYTCILSPPETSDPPCSIMS